MTQVSPKVHGNWRLGTKGRSIDGQCVLLGVLGGPFSLCWHSTLLLSSEWALDESLSATAALHDMRQENALTLSLCSEPQSWAELTSFLPKLPVWGHLATVMKSSLVHIDCFGWNSPTCTCIKCLVPDYGAILARHLWNVKLNWQCPPLLLVGLDLFPDPAAAWAVCPKFHRAAINGCPMPSVPLWTEPPTQ